MKRTPAFTLVETMVVLLLGAILLLLLQGITGRARTAATNTRCVSNLRILSLGALRYMNDLGGTLLPGKSYTNPSFRTDKPGLRDYVGIDSRNTKVNAPEFQVDTAFTCPEMRSKYPHLYPSYLNRSYVINFYAYKDDPENLDEPAAVRLPPSPHFAGTLANIPSPGQMWMFADGCIRNGVTLPTYMKPSFTTADYDLGLHDGRQNVVFFDGHVEALTRQDFITRSRRSFWGVVTAQE